MKKLLLLILILSMALSCFVGCTDEKNKNNTNSKQENEKIDYSNEQVLNLDGDKATLNGVDVKEFDYTWHCDPSVSHDEVKNAPAEYYTGTKPETDDAVYIDHDLNYFPSLDENGFKLQNYDGEREWVYYYTDGENNDYIFATLPTLGNKLPTQMMSTAQEAEKNKVLHITKPGTYVLQGEWKGQILIDLGDEDENFTNPQAKVTVILNGVDVTCTVAPAIVFRDIYECDNAWEERDSHSEVVDTLNAGANVVVAENTTNNFSGKNIYRMLKTTYKDENTKVQKKMRKIDAAFYSYVSMNISGDGALNITSEFEGLDSELHLTINGGNITINSQDDGINVNEDNVSVLTVNGGNTTLNAALGAEGDGIDSNGFVVLNGGVLNINGITAPDSAIDSEDGIYYNAGKVVIDDKEQTYTAGSMFRETGGMGGFGGKDFGEKPNNFNNSDFDLQTFKKEVAQLGDDATIEDVLKLLGMDMFKGDRPNDMAQPPEKPIG